MQDRLVDVLTQLVRVPSVTSDIEEQHIILDMVAEMFGGTAAKLHKHVYERVPSLIIQNFEGKHADVVLCGHLDVVPASEDNQFSPVVKDGKIYARGAGDMKDGCAILICLMQELLASESNLKVALWLVCDEEVGGTYGVKALVADGRGGDIALIPDSGSLTEVTIATKGIVTTQIHLAGESAHSSRPWLGRNALEQAYELYREIVTLLEDSTALYETDEHRGTSVQMTMLEGGHAMNAIPADATMTINIRFTEQYTSDLIRTKIEGLLSDFHAEIVSWGEGPLMHTAADHPVIASYQQIAQEVIGEPIVLNREHGTTDGRWFPSETIVILHQPTDANIHGKGEYTILDHLEKIYETFKMFVLGLK